MKRIKDFLLSIMVELLMQGKMLSGYFLMQAFGDYPLIIGAIEAFMNDPSSANLVQLIIQVIMVFGTGARTVKVLKAALVRMEK